MREMDEIFSVACQFVDSDALFLSRSLSLSLIALRANGLMLSLALSRCT